MPQIKDKIVILGADHNGVELKKIVKEQLIRDGYACIDIGPHQSISPVDYVDYAKTLGHIINNGEANWGVLICGTGVGLNMVANRFNNVRAALVHNLETAHKTREHNDANVLCLGAWINSIQTNLEIVRAWFNEPFGQGRHVPRVEKFSSNKAKVVFTNGIFDILHPGHIHLLEFAKSLGDKLIVGINSDRATQILKGPGRPINNQQARKEVLKSLDCVDEVVIFDDVKTYDTLRRFKPDILVKGGEWTPEQIRQRDKVPAEIDIKIYPVEPGHSTTDTLKKVKESDLSAEYNKDEYNKIVTQ